MQKIISIFLILFWCLWCFDRAFAATSPSLDILPLKPISTIDASKNISIVKSNKIILVYWTWWCSICKKQLENLTKLQQKNPDIQIFSISVDDRNKNHSKTLKFAKKFNFPAFYLLDFDRQLNQYYPESIPTTIFISNQILTTLEGEIPVSQMQQLIQ
jgi:thiol-disulfide isomerase/thioredoxin